MTSAAPTASAPPILGRAWDFLFLGPGATVLVSALYVGAVVLGRPGMSTTLVATLSLLVLGPHYAATYRRAYGSFDVLRAHPAVTLVAPVFLVAAAVLAVRSPTGFGPFYFLGYVAWSGYHYSGQSLGITMLYPLRQRARLDAREKRLLAAPLYASWLVSLIGLAHAESGARNPAYAIVRDHFVPVNLPTSVLFALLAPLLLSFGGVAVVARERRHRGVPLPLACYGVIAAQVSWFGFGLFFPFFNIALVPVFHSLQYLALTGWHFTRGPRAPGLVSFAAYVLVVVALGVVINPGLLVIFAPSGTSTLGPTVAAAVISAVNLHHFLMDGRIWRMRERRVAEAFTG
ncbi:MAG TPA: hypothetical protein VLA14_08375 [Polyangia bacterium]|nr:hypothetical protein [Polyangia bacterium]